MRNIGSRKVPQQREGPCALGSNNTLNRWAIRRQGSGGQRAGLVDAKTVWRGIRNSGRAQTVGGLFPLPGWVGSVQLSSATTHPCLDLRYRKTEDVTQVSVLAPCPVCGVHAAKGLPARSKAGVRNEALGMPLLIRQLFTESKINCDCDPGSTEMTAIVASDDSLPQID